MKILIIEDEEEIASAIGEYLSSNENVFSISNDIEDARKQVYQADWDCVLLDIGLPSGSGLELIEEIKNIHPHCIIIILSAKNSDLDKINGLEFGADDYMTKPFNLAELIARINAIKRRLSPNTEMTLSYEGLRLNENKFEVHFHLLKIEVTKIEFYLLRLFLTNPNKVISKTAILETIWQEDAESINSEDILYNHIKNIRKKLEDAGAKDFIKTIYGVGYKLN